LNLANPASPRPDAARLKMDYFDGRSAQAHTVLIWIEHDMLQMVGHGLLKQAPLRQVQWPERTRHGARMVHLADGGSLHTHDSAAWDAWAQQHGLNDSLVTQAQQSWRWSLMATLLLLAICVASYCWGMPMTNHHVSAQALVSMDDQQGQLAV
jgi:hypothetical protein